VIVLYEDGRRSDAVHSAVKAPMLRERADGDAVLREVAPRAIAQAPAAPLPTLAA